MPLISTLIGKLQRHPKRFIFPEGSNPRVIQAARQIVTRKMGVPILLGDRAQIKATAEKHQISLEKTRIITPERSDDFPQFVEKFLEIRQKKGITQAHAEEKLRDNNYFATMMLATSQGDALISGTTEAASSGLRPLFQIIPKQDGVQTASSLLILDLEERKVGVDGVLFLADCGVIPEPTTEQLSEIAITTALLAYHLTNAAPRVAMLSYSTKSSASQPGLQRIRQATDGARQKAQELSIPMEIEGEIQVDTALDPATAQAKGLLGPVAGQANVLIFPDLNSGNIASKMVQILTGANSYGQIITGLSKPAAEVSRGASAHDILGAAAIVGCQAIDRKLLYGTE
jgi:phosphate acetyltransferase